MLLFFALNLLIVTYVNSNEIEKVTTNNLQFQNKLYSKEYITNNSTENLTILNYNLTSLDEEENQNNQNLLNSFTKAASNIRLFFENSEKENSESNDNTLNFLNFLSSSQQPQKQKLRFLQKFICENSTISCSGHGECTPDKLNCMCESGFTTFPDPKDQIENNQRCNYEKKKQLKAFLFELFLGFGAGHFYTERYTMAGLKLGAFIFGIFIICLFPITAKFLSEKLESDCLVLSVSCFYYLCSVGLAFWFIYDLVMFGMNKYNDGNGIQLQSWSKNPELQQ